MYLRIGKRIINTDNLVDAELYEEGEDLSPHLAEAAADKTVVLHMTAVQQDLDGSLAPRTIWLHGEDADTFLDALPVYEPVEEE